MGPILSFLDWLSTYLRQSLKTATPRKLLFSAFLLACITFLFLGILEPSSIGGIPRIRFFTAALLSLLGLILVEITRKLIIQHSIKNDFPPFVHTLEDYQQNMFHIKSLFFQRINIFLFFSFFPLMNFQLLMGRYLSFGIVGTGACICFFNIYLLKKERLDSSVILLSLFLYPVILLSPFYSHAYQSASNCFFVVFILVSFATTKKYLHILNVVFLIVSLVSHHFILQSPYIVSNTPLFLGKMLLHVINLSVVLSTIYYYQKEVGIYKNNIENSFSFLKQVIDLNPNYLFAKNKKREFTFMNPSMLEAMGGNTEAIIGKRTEDILEKSQVREQVKSDDESVIAYGITKFIPKEKIFSPSGNETLVETVKRPLRDSQGNIQGIIAFATDISEREKAKWELVQSERRFRSIVENNAFGIVTHVNGTVVEVNDSFCKILGYQAKELEGIRIKEFFHPDSWPKAKERLKYVYTDDQKRHEGEFQLIKKNGEFCDIFFAVQFLEDENGKYKETIGAVMDMTPLKKAEEALRKSEEQYRWIFEKTPVGMVLSKRGKFTQVNPEVCKMLGYSEAELLSLNIFDVTHPEEHPILRSKIPNFINTNEGHVQIEIRLLSKDRKVLHALLNVQRLFNSQGKYEESIISIMDITEKRKAEIIIQEQVESLNKKNQELERYISSNKQLENFAFLASHDIKAPIRTIISFIQLLQKSTQDKLNDKERTYMEFIVSGAKSMKRITEGLLKFSLVKSSTKSRDLVDVNTLVENILRENQYTVQRSNAKIQTGNMPTQLVADQTQMRQLFQNLILNALKFTKKDASPDVEILALEELDHWKFSVKDNGIGIKTEYQESIFNLFQKLHGSKHFEGSGIGLAICKRIVESHQGKIWVESCFGEGSTFYFTIEKSSQGTS